jgi:hypothetical protein
MVVITFKVRNFCSKGRHCDYSLPERQKNLATPLMRTTLSVLLADETADPTR